MSYENRFDGYLEVTSATAETVEIPEELRAQVDALGLTLTPKASQVSAADVFASLKEQPEGSRFLHYFKFDKKASRIVANPHATPGNFYEFGAAVKQVAAAFDDAGYRLVGDVYRLGEERDDVERARVNGKEVQVEYAEVAFKFSDGSLYTPLPL